MPNSSSLPAVQASLRFQQRRRWRERTVMRKFRAEDCKGLSSRDRVVPAQGSDYIVAQHNVAAVRKQINLHVLEPSSPPSVHEVQQEMIPPSIRRALLTLIPVLATAASEYVHFEVPCTASL